ncbi:MAG: GlxA family transcriptional regulator [Porticoccaceae bacterium]|jgi:transcriptional regulator GlxA family with amidase domain|nr:GlxA family transcriptional regulator [Porticoccaceae bacterium]MBT3798167.1 GlxA family transcriptional regulator [Porticoccaceae bacterium]MBT4164422.1 GlxA family transcriptional regulator [Porticoccaceae bacterium]MBT4210579.1 GlxA family transcriptional regulator [Porticoccaceae bacterium]MBT4591219.1 GlxA family transcriptional regulator [Porticoccaceae bacterium]
MKKPTTEQSKPVNNSTHLSVGFVLMPSFTLLPFSAFVDALRLAADEGDQSRQMNCQWTVMGPTLEAIASSSGVTVQPWETYRNPADFDYVVVVGGLLNNTLQGSQHVVDYLQQVDAAHVPIIGLCTGSFVMIRAGLMEQRRCCVSWFHYKDLTDRYTNVTPIADQLFVDDGDRITCAGGAVAADLAAYIIERHLGQNWARKSLRILVMDSPRPANAPQPQPGADYHVNNRLVERALLLMEQNLSRPLSTDQIATRVNISKRQLERLFTSETNDSLQRFYRKIRLRYGLWLLQNTTRLITDIAQECGFADTAHFSRAFRAAFDKKPTDYRT